MCGQWAGNYVPKEYAETIIKPIRESFS
jgi:hypothetical protein